MSQPSHHRLLKRQIRRHLAGAEDIQERLGALFEAVSAAYEAADEDRAMLQRSMEISSRELVEANSSLMEANDAALAAVEAKTEFLATMSHEIRTPINGIIGMTGLLMDTELDFEQRDFADTIESSAASLLAIVSDILDYSKIEAGGMEFDYTTCDLRRLVDDSFSLVAKAAEDRDVELCHMVHAQLPHSIECDTTRVRQILLNFLSNAVKFTEHGDVSLIVTRDADDMIRFELSDTGIGIPEEGMKRLFQTFSQVDASTTRRYGGTGLGLAISKQLAQGMGGDVGVRSEAGVGSTFWFTIPLREAEDAPSDTHSNPDLTGRRVLVIDDNATNRKFLRYLVSTWGGEVDEVIDGPGALRALAEKPDGWDLALLDFQMPGMDGEQVLRHIRNEPSTAGLPVIMLTSISDSGLARRLMEIGLDGYLTKPIKHSQLVELTKKVLASRAPTVSSPSANGKRALVVDDNPANRRLMVSGLAHAGYTCEEAADGEAAVAMHADSPYDLIFMDLVMPRCDGFEATRRIRALPTGQEVLIIGNSADDDADLACEEAGMNRFLSRPFEWDRINETIAAIPPLRMPGDAAQEPLIVGARENKIEERRETGGPAAVLLAEDHPANQKVVITLLNRLGHEVVLAETGREAVAAYRSQFFDLVLMDVMMPEMDGLEATRAIRAIEGTNQRRTPIVALTANAGLDDQRACFDAGVDEFHSKPLSLTKLKEILKTWLGSRASAEPSGRRTAASPDEPARAGLAPSTSAPTLSAPGVPAPAIEADPGSAFDQPVVLLVDDNEVNRRVMGKQLEKMGYSVAYAPGGRKAIELFERLDVGVVLLDFRMPDYSGSEVATEMRRMEVEADRGRCPIIGLTAGVSERDRAAFIRAGVDSVMIKPTPIEALQEALSRVLAPVIQEEAPTEVMELRAAVFATDGPAPKRLASKDALAVEPTGKVQVALVLASGRMSRTLLEGTVQPKANRCELVDTMEDAMDAFGEMQFDLLVVDLDVDDDASELLAAAATRGTRVITVGRSTEAPLGVHAHFPKPVDTDGLVGALTGSSRRVA